MTDLFRRQALDHQRQKFHGAIVIARHPWQTATTAFFVALVGALLAFAATSGFARRESVAGVLAPAGGVLRLVAPAAGIVLPGVPPQGTTVAAGATVFRLSRERSSAAGVTQETIAASLERQRASLQQELGQQQAQAREQAQALDAHLAGVEAGLRQQAREIALQRERVALARDVADRYPELVRSGAVSPVEASDRATESLQQQSRLAELQRAEEAARSDLAQLKAQRGELALAARREAARLQREIDTLAGSQAETAERRETLVQAPRPGELAAVLAETGQAVEAGQTLATLVPAGSRLEAELRVPSRAAGQLSVGMPVWVRVDAFPFARFGQIGGHVRDISRSAVPQAAGPAAATTAVEADPSYRVHVSLDETAGPAAAWRGGLKPGMRVQASLVTERRTLLQWAFEPLQAMRVAAQ